MNPNSTNETESKQSMNSVDKAKSLVEILESDLDACDFKWTLFVSAANNYKYDSLLKPFPTAYVANKILYIDRLREMIACVPAFDVLLPKLRSFCDHTSMGNSINAEIIDLLYWCLISVREPVLKTVNRANVSIILFNWHQFVFLFFSAIQQ